MVLLFSCSSQLTVKLVMFMNISIQVYGPVFMLTLPKNIFFLPAHKFEMQKGLRTPQPPCNTVHYNSFGYNRFKYGSQKYVDYAEIANGLFSV